MAPTIGQIAAASYVAVLNKRKAENQWVENTVLDEFQSAGFIKKKSFGEVLELGLDYQRNPNGDFLATDMTPTSLSKTEVLTSAQYSIAELSVPVTWSKGDDMKNPSENQKFDFVNTLLNNGLDSHDDMIEEALFATSTDGFLGFQTIIPDSGQGSVGGISAVTEVWWRNDTDTYLDDASDIEAKMTGSWNAASKGSGGMAPSLIVSGGDAQALFESTQQPLQRYVDGAKMNAGFKVLAFKTARYIFAQYGGTRIYMMSPKALSLYVSAQYFRDKGEQQEIPNVNAYTFKIYSGLQLATVNKSRLSVLTQTAA